MQLSKTTINELLMENLLLHNNSVFTLLVNIYNTDGKKYEHTTRAKFNTKGKLDTIDTVMFTAEKTITLESLEVIFEELNLTKTIKLRVPETTNSRTLGAGDTFHFTLELNEFFEGVDV